MAGLFSLPPRATREGDSAISKKASKKGQTANISIKGGGGLLERISTITAMVNKNLGKYKDQYIAIRDDKEFVQYIDESIKNGIIAIDTETNSLDPITCKLAGLCLYTPGKKAAYIPLHHVSYVTGIEVEDQISDELAAEQMQRLVDNGTQIIMFNAKFDVRVIRNQLKVRLIPTWDGYIAARLLNENEGDGNNNLKTLHNKYCQNGEGDAFTFQKLFEGIPFTHIPINTGYLYAARDAEVTYELYLFQKPFLTADDPVCIKQDLTGPAFVMSNVEMPLIPIVADMEDTGVAIDFEYSKKLSEQYNAILEEKKERFYKICDMFGQQLDDYRTKMGAANKLEYPINISSPQQIAIMLYDVLGIDPPGKGRGTGEEVLVQIDHPVAKAVLEYREVVKLLGTYIDKMPAIANPKTDRIHCSFNQVGTVTGRFSSSDPNMQNIPAHNKDIRKMFVATKGYAMIGADYSAQEPRITAHMSKDVRMIAAYKEGKDLYCEIASIAFNVPYDECKEYRPDGTKNDEGKERRGRAKAIVLGVCYGKGVPAIADDLRISVKLAQQIYDKIMIEFPGLKQFMEDSENMARELGYVTTMFGRKRRLPDIQLPPYEFSWVSGTVAPNFDPLAFDEDFEEESEVPEEVIERYTKMLNKAFNRKKKAEIVGRAKGEGIHIRDNGGYIAQAVRQCVNSRIQGGAGDQIKLAMILVGSDPELKELGFRLILQVHDELIGEAPLENAGKAAERFKYLMQIAIKDYLSVPSICDIEITDRWYGEELEVS